MSKTQTRNFAQVTSNGGRVNVFKKRTKFLSSRIHGVRRVFDPRHIRYLPIIRHVRYRRKQTNEKPDDVEKAVTELVRHAQSRGGRALILK